MDTVLWIIQWVLVVKLLRTAFTHGPGRGRPVFQEALGCARSARFWLSLGAAACLLGSCALTTLAFIPAGRGLVAPVSAALGAMFLASVFLHTRYREQPKTFAGIILAVLAALLALGRSLFTPF